MGATPRGMTLSPTAFDCVRQLIRIAFAGKGGFVNTTVVLFLRFFSKGSDDGTRHVTN